MCCIHHLGLDCIVSTHPVGDGAVVSAPVGPTSSGEASEGCWTALHFIKLSNARQHQCCCHGQVWHELSSFTQHLPVLGFTMESPRDCWSTRVVQNVAKLDIWGRMEIEEGKTGGYLMLSRLREMESEMEKNQVCDGQERLFC